QINYLVNRTVEDGVQVLRCLRIRDPAIPDQPHRLKLELPRKPSSLHDSPPAPSKHLTRCLRYRVQAKKPSQTRTQTLPLEDRVHDCGAPVRIRAARESHHFATGTWPLTRFPSRGIIETLD